MLLYGVLFAGAFARFPPGRDRPQIDTQEVRHTIFMTEPRYVALGLDPLAKPGKKIILLGGSTVREGFRQAPLQAALPGYEVHNLGIGAGNITEVAQTFQFVTESVTAASLRESVVVIGLFYGQFVDDETRWRGGETSLMKERLRYGLYRRRGGEVLPIAGPEVMSALDVLLRPVLFVHSWIASPAIQIGATHVEAVVNRLVHAHGIDLSAFTWDPPPVDEATRARALEAWQAYMGTPDGTLRDQQFEALVGLCERIDQTGARLLLVGMPLPEWHRNGSGYTKAYQQKMEAVLARVSVRRVEYFDMIAAMPDSDFYDSAHPLPSAAPRWVAMLAGRLSQLVHQE
jgi:hypothetical protein